MASTQEWIDELKSISVLELAERIKALEEEFGVSATAVAAAAPAAAGDGGGAAEGAGRLCVRGASRGGRPSPVVGGAMQARRRSARTRSPDCAHPPWSVSRRTRTMHRHTRMLSTPKGVRVHN